MLIPLETDASIPIETILERVTGVGIGATVHWNNQRRRVVASLDGDATTDRAQKVSLAKTLSDAYQIYFDLGDDTSPLSDGQSREIACTFPKAPTVDVIRDIASRESDPEKDNGPEVPPGINLMGKTGTAEVGDVRACAPAGFVQSYLADSTRGLERLAGVVGQVVVRHNDGYWVKSPAGAWSATTQGAAIGKVKSVWRGLLKNQGVRCTHGHIEELFRRSLLPVIDGTLTSPVEADFVEYLDRVYLNIRLAPRLEPTKLGEDGQLIREFVLRNLLNDHRQIEQVEAEVSDPKSKTPTRWALNWIAHIYRRPGIALPTCLWLISVEQGIGKTLFGSMLAELVGQRNAVRADQSEMTGDWSDWLVGRSLIIADEINVTERKQFYARQKTWIGSRSISVRRRGVGTWEIPTIANWLFLTNDLQPIRIDGADRRNMLIASSNDRDAARAMIERLHPILNDPERYRHALAEFGGWLDQIEIDAALLSRSVPTEIKDDLIESTQDAVVSFVQDQVEQRAWRSGSRLSTAELFSRYNVWCDQTKAFAGYRSQSHLVQGLKKLRALGWIEHHRTSDSRGWVLRSVPGQPEAATEEVEFITQPVVQFTKARALMERMKAQQQVH